MIRGFIISYYDVRDVTIKKLYHFNPNKYFEQYFTFERVYIIPIHIPTDSITIRKVSNTG